MTEIIRGAPIPDAPAKEGREIAWIRAGLEALETRLAAKDGRATSDERAVLLTLVMSLEDTLATLAAEPGSPLDRTLADLRAHLADVSGRVRTRVVSSGAAQAARARSPLLKIVPWTRSASPHPGQGLRRASRVMTTMGVFVSAFLVFEFGLSGLQHDRAQRNLLAAFKQAIQTTTLDSPTALPSEGSPVALLAIPAIGLNEVVVEGTTPDDLKMGPGHLRAAPLPGEFGNAVLIGRRTTYGAPFKNLGGLRLGDRIRVATGQGVFTYTVSSTRRAGAGEAGPLTATLDSRLTLVTSDPAFAPTGRLIVTARLAPVAAVADPKGTPVDVASRPPVAASISELGLAGDPVGLVAALLWTQALLLAIWLIVRLSRRWPISLTLMLATPTLLALAVLSFSSIDRLLPGTL